MCGIAGIVGPGSSSVSTLNDMASAMIHRGPDGQGVWHDDRAGLAFRRLAVIDLDPRSNQPLHLGPLHLVFNGEIYNYVELRDELRARGHSFQTSGDGEVLLHAWAEWGPSALDRLNGMFAIAVWDDVRKRLSMATDRFAEKPLFFHSDNVRLLFASDVRALLVADRRLAHPDERALAAFVALGETPVLPKTFFAAIRRVPPGHIAVWENQELSLRRYWNPRCVGVPTSLHEAAEELRELLLDSIRLRLRSDVAVGTSLSGGIDSSAVLGLSATLSGENRHDAFTATFPGFTHDEWGYASAAAQMAGVRTHHAVQPSAQDFLRDIERVVGDQEEPFATMSIYAQWRVMQAVREAGVTVLLDGQGADELFAGYGGMEAWSTRSQGFRSMVTHTVSNHRSIRELLATYYSRPVKAPLRRRRVSRNASPYASSDAVRLIETHSEAPRDWAASGSPIRKELLHQAFRSLLPDICRFADKNSMAHSVEVRLPFLDYRVAEFAFSLPADFLVAHGTSKRVLRVAAHGYAPDIVLARRDKIGYATPETTWLQEPKVMRWFTDVLSDPAVASSGRYAMTEVARDARSGQWRDVRGIWRAVNAELWRAAYSHTAGPVAA